MLPLCRSRGTRACATMRACSAVASVHAKVVRGVKVPRSDGVVSTTGFRIGELPREYVNMRHPDDFVIVGEFHPETWVVDTYRGPRAVGRLAWKIDDKFLPVTFLLCNGLLNSDGDGLGYVPVRHRDPMLRVATTYRAPVATSPPSHAPVNIVGLDLLVKMGFIMMRNGRVEFRYSDGIL
ncbi:unnamed protein product (mitochondrion) [Plasmodiophora brassicae]|uniref:Uncharacterized protein n=1 Tax=Plasmodiophora brassicae TaxID=37360 RepID=A0A3P3Y6S9_PLABS|nr:unnamed protein product [Plasmodiophora brassicae]